MRIVHICQRDDPDTGGSLRVAEALVHEQRASGIESWLLFLYGGPSHVAKALEPETVCLELESSRQAFKGVFLLCRAIRRIKPDIIHSHDGILWPRLAFMQFRVPVVMHSHLPVGSSDSWMARKLIARTTKVLIGISLHTVETWVKSGFPPSRIHYVPNGVDFNRFSPAGKDVREELRNRLGLSADKKVLLWVGRLHRSMKGSDRVERVAGLLPENQMLVVVGNGPEFEGMNERCKPLVDSGKMVMVGSASTPEEYYQAADSFLFTSYHEPFGLVILEAVASGLPIVAFPVTQGGGAVRLLKEFDATMVEDAGSDDEVCAVLESLATRSGSADARRKAAMAKYSWSQVSKKVMDVYKIVLNKTH